MARSKTLSPHVGRLSRSQVFAKRGLHKGQKKSEKLAVPETPLTREVSVGGEKNGSTRTVPTSKAPRYYPAEDVRKPKKSRKTIVPTKLRPSITPGTVLILLAGRFRGKRVVFLKQLESGLLLVTGPFRVNGVPLRRVNQAYVIATSTKIDFEGITIDEKINDAYFAKAPIKGRTSAEEEFFAEGKPKEKEPIPESKAADQKAVDKAIIAAIREEEYLAKYLKATFGLTKGQYPHQLKF
ncbi:60S ribosomal protein L6 [Thelephora ganbajun]|uniref:60S ribosomal protein L6 n=1 Tax=Thelephora ganbajun TaxID=370292 RepID=A0ACB6ZRH1_THEGA|nr:60S ribosomal protein L6 [Thelephora ganbajun]